MPDKAPETIGNYTIASELGRGGMGVVYLAEDPKLERKVAIKVLGEEFSSDEDKLSRFIQEAKATSALNHPNILTVYEIGEHEGAPFIVSEFLDGKELRDLLAEGPIPVRRAVDFAKQIVNGLVAAHEKGIVHRDLKPENIFITGDDRVKILDFGLAKLKTADGVGSEDATRQAITDPGIVMGTVGYMSPEQVRGQNVDHRSDIFSLGVIFHEILTGRKLFQRDTMAETMAAILKEEPPDIKDTVPDRNLAFELIIRRCLEKRPERRFQSTADLAFALDSLSTVSTASGGAVTRAISALPEDRRSDPSAGYLPWGLAAALLLGLLGSLLYFLVLAPAGGQSESDSVRFSVNAPSGSARLREARISPDGKTLAFIASTKGEYHIWTRSMDSLATKRLTEKPISGVFAWSPDSSRIAFPSDFKLVMVEVTTGTVQTITSLPADHRLGEGATDWSEAGDILYFSGEAIYTVSERGGEAKELQAIEPETEGKYLSWPRFLPDGRQYVYHLQTPEEGSAGIYLSSLDDPGGKLLMASSEYADPVALSDGSTHLMFVRENTVWMQMFDPASGKLVGDEFTPPGIEKVANVSDARGLISVARDGSAVFVESDASAERQLVWVDRTGKILSKIGSPGWYRSPRLSPDGSKIAVETTTKPGADDSKILLMDAETGESTRFTFGEGQDSYPIWTPDGESLTWANKQQKTVIYMQPVRGTAAKQAILEIEDGSPDDWSPNGKVLLFDQAGKETKSDIWSFDTSAGGKPDLFVGTETNEGRARFSPDGRWVAFNTRGSDGGAGSDTYVQPYPPTGSKWLVSLNGGDYPHWSADGKELFFISEGKLMVVEIRASDTFEYGQPRLLFDLEEINGIPSGRFAVSRDGQKFLVYIQDSEDAGLTFTVFTNWLSVVERAIKDK